MCGHVAGSPHVFPLTAARHQSRPYDLMATLHAVYLHRLSVWCQSGLTRFVEMIICDDAGNY